MFKVVRSRVSESAKTIATALGCKMNKNPTQHWPPQIFPRSDKIVINWGNWQEFAVPRTSLLLNKPQAVDYARNKIKTFELLDAQGIPIPYWTTEIPNQLERGNNAIWLQRATVTGSGGEGITVIREENTFGRAPLYVKYIRKSAEYRVHVVNGVAIQTAQKRRELDNEQTPDQALIRNHENGWIFAVNDVTPLTRETLALAVRAVTALGLDFGAVDLIIEKNTNRAVILEINSAPGLGSPTTIEAYRKAFVELAAQRGM